MQYITAGNLPGFHLLVDLGQLIKRYNFEGRTDSTSSEELQSLGAVGAVANVRTLDGDHFDDKFENRSGEFGMGGETNGDDSSVRSNVFSGLLKWLLCYSDEEDCVGSVAVGSCSLDSLDNVFLGEVDKSLNAELSIW